MTTEFKFTRALRAAIRLLLGVSGGTGSGKTYSALLLAKGLAGGKRFAVIDTENGRASMYADDFDFDVVDLREFRPGAYTAAIDAAEKQGYPVIVVDSMSHEYAGDGGLLDWHEDELAEMVKRARKAGDDRADWQIEDANNMRAWIEPKMAHKKMVSRFLQLKCHLILCFRAEPKIEITKEGKKTVIKPKETLTGLNGWVPVTEKNLPYELTASVLLMADKPGVPMWIKVMQRHQQFFPTDKPISEETGRRIGEWAAGGGTATERTVAAAPPFDVVAMCRKMESAKTGAELREYADQCKGVTGEDRDTAMAVYKASLARILREESAAGGWPPPKPAPEPEPVAVPPATEDEEPWI